MNASAPVNSKIKAENGNNHKKILNQICVFASHFLDNL